MTDVDLFAQVIDPANRADPYPLYAKLLETPVTRAEDGAYVVSTFAEIRGLLKDPRVSSQDMPKPLFARTGNPITDFILNPLRGRIIHRHRSLIFRDPPDHTAMRGALGPLFGPDRIKSLAGRIREIVDGLIDEMRDRATIDVVGDFAYPLPVTVICELLGVPAQDEAMFHPWSAVLTEGLEPNLRIAAEENRAQYAAFEALAAYLGGLLEEKRRHPTEDVLSGLATYKDPGGRSLNKHDVVSNAILLLVGGHETTVNLIANAVLTLLRHPAQFARLRKDASVAPALVDEVLRFDPPGHFRTRKTLADIEVAGTSVPKGSSLVLLFAAASRDPRRFRNPERFDPDRPENNQHLGFGSGPHYCLGAHLARLEAEIALVALAKRLVAPRLVADPPPYRIGASLRGPERLELRVEGILPAA